MFLKAPSNFIDNITLAMVVYDVVEDGELMTDLGIDAYQFSMSWTRILPGKLVYNMMEECSYCP